MGARMKLAACVVGSAVGDALGVPYEFRERGTFECAGMVGGGAHRQPAGTWSDDTSMILATVDSLRSCGWEVDVYDMRMRFRWFADIGRYTVDREVFDIGRTTARALEAGHGMSDEQSQGNGSLMRILPLAFAYADDQDIGRVSAITHSHPACMGACVQLVHIARTIANGVHPRMAVALESRDLYRRCRDRRSAIRSTGCVVDTLEAALWCLLNTSSYRDCVLEAVNLGGDTDTIACISGGLAGIAYGMHSIPIEWISRLRGKSVIRNILI